MPRAADNGYVTWNSTQRKVPRTFSPVWYTTPEQNCFEEAGLLLGKLPSTFKFHLGYTDVLTPEIFDSNKAAFNCTKDQT